MFAYFQQPEIIKNKKKYKRKSTKKSMERVIKFPM